jgi:glycosyltransferase involved in cell wall biosynthesis
LPNALLEANARGLCVIACDAGGVRDAVRDCETGVLAERGNAEALSARILALCADPAERLRLARAALLTNAHLFDAEAGYDRIAALLRQATGGACG